MSGCGVGLLSPPGGVPDAEARRLAIEARARAAGFQALGTGTSAAEEALPVAAWLRPAAQDAPLRVYFEGDGLAFRSRYRVSSDPTPVRAVGLELAIRDPHAGPVIYLARPCQSTGLRSPSCHAGLWTAARYGDEVLAALDERLDAIRGEWALSGPLTLIGYSGGGVLAALLTAQRGDVDSLMTIAAPLDVEGWTEAARVPSLAGSRSPMEPAYLAALRRVRQIHFSGAEDEIVRPPVVQAFHEALGVDAPSRHRIVERMNHTGWPARWLELLSDERSGQGPAERLLDAVLHRNCMCLPSRRSQWDGPELIRSICQEGLRDGVRIESAGQSFSQGRESNDASEQ